jgi:hypothetical protein
VKPEYQTPPPRELTYDENLILRMATAEGGRHPVPMRGAKEFATGRRLAKMGLGEVEGREFRINDRGAAAAPKKDDS